MDGSAGKCFVGEKGEDQDRAPSQPRSLSLRAMSGDLAPSSLGVPERRDPVECKRLPCRKKSRTTFFLFLFSFFVVYEITAVTL